MMTVRKMAQWPNREGTVARTSPKKYASHTTQQLAPIILKLHFNTHNEPTTPHVAPKRISHHIHLFFNVTTRAARTRSNSHPTAARTFFMMNSLKNPRGSHHTASRTTAPYYLTLQPARLAPAATRTPQWLAPHFLMN